MRANIYYLFIILLLTTLIPIHQTHADDICLAALLAKLPLTKPLRRVSPASEDLDVALARKISVRTKEDVEASASFLQAVLRKSGVDSEIEPVHRSLLIIKPNEKTWQGQFASILESLGRKFAVTLSYEGGATTLPGWGIVCNRAQILWPIWPTWVARELGHTLLENLRSNYIAGQAHPPPPSLRILPGPKFQLPMYTLSPRLVSAYAVAMDLPKLDNPQEFLRAYLRENQKVSVGYVAENSWTLTVEATESYSRALVMMKELARSDNARDRGELRQYLRAAVINSILAQVYAQETEEILDGVLDSLKSGIRDTIRISKHRGTLSGDVELENRRTGDRISVSSDEIIRLFGFSQNWYEDPYNWREVVEKSLTENREEMNRVVPFGTSVANSIYSTSRKVFRQ